MATHSTIYLEVTDIISVYLSSHSPRWVLSPCSGTPWRHWWASSSWTTLRRTWAETWRRLVLVRFVCCSSTDRPTDRPPPSSHRALRTSHFSLKYLQARLRPCGFRPTWMMTSITSCSGTRSELRDRFSNLGETDRLSNLGERDRLSNHGDRSVVKGCGCDGRNGAAVETGNVV